MARRVFDQNSFGKLRLIGALLAEMDLLDGGRLAAMYLNDDIMNATGTTYNDTEGLINLPLTAREIQAVVFFKLGADGDIHVSMRSKYDVDVRSVAARHGGGGHKNAAGFKVTGPLDCGARWHPQGNRGRHRDRRADEAGSPARQIRPNSGTLGTGNWLLGLTSCTMHGALTRRQAVRDRPRTMSSRSRGAR